MFQILSKFVSLMWSETELKYPRDQSKPNYGKINWTYLVLTFSWWSEPQFECSKTHPLIANTRSLRLFSYRLLLYGNRNGLKQIYTHWTTRYQGGVGQLSFILHRLTGLGTLLFLNVHILDTSTVYFFPSLYEEAIALYRSTPFIIGEIILVFSVIYHGVNNVRFAIFDLFSPKSWRKSSQIKTALVSLAIAVLLRLPAAFSMGCNLLIHNFGL